MHRKHSLFAFSLVVIVGGAMVGALLGGWWIWLHYLCKPLATVLLLWSAWRVQAPVSARYRNWVVAGLALSLLGDICLMLPVDAFLAGLGAFLLAHVCYIAAFSTDSGWRSKALFMGLFGVVAVVNLAALWPRLEPAMRLPVLVYGSVLAGMAGVAWARWRDLKGGAAVTGQRYAAARAAQGGLLFVISDSLLAWDRFGGGIAWEPLWVLASYYAAQWCIAASVDPGRRGG